MAASRALVDLFLVVRDEIERTALRLALESDGYAVTVASSFSEARKRLAEHPPTLLVTDIRLGLFNGLQLALLSRGTPVKATFVMDAKYDPTLETVAKQFGATYLVKPVAPHALSRQANALFGNALVAASA